MTRAKLSGLILGILLSLASGPGGAQAGNPLSGSSGALIGEYSCSEGPMRLYVEWMMGDRIQAYERHAGARVMHSATRQSFRNDGSRQLQDASGSWFLYVGARRSLAVRDAGGGEFEAHWLGPGEGMRPDSRCPAAFRLKPSALSPTELYEDFLALAAHPDPRPRDAEAVVAAAQRLPESGILPASQSRFPERAKEAHLSFWRRFREALKTRIDGYPDFSTPEAVQAYREDLEAVHSPRLSEDGRGGIFGFPHDRLRKGSDILAGAGLLTRPAKPSAPDAAFCQAVLVSAQGEYGSSDLRPIEIHLRYPGEYWDEEFLQDLLAAAGSCQGGAAFTSFIARRVDGLRSAHQDMKILHAVVAEKKALPDTLEALGGTDWRSPPPLESLGLSSPRSAWGDFSSRFHEDALRAEIGRRVGQLKGESLQAMLLAALAGPEGRAKAEAICAQIPRDRFRSPEPMRDLAEECGQMLREAIQKRGRRRD